MHSCCDKKKLLVNGSRGMLLQVIHLSKFGQFIPKSVVVSVIIAVLLMNERTNL